MTEETASAAEAKSPSELFKPYDVLGLGVKDAFSLGDNRLEITWDPKDMDVPEELEYISERATMNTHRTNLQGALAAPPLEYLFTPEGKFRGIRCGMVLWEFLLRGNQGTDQTIADFRLMVEKLPKKKLAPIMPAQPAPVILRPDHSS